MSKVYICLLVIFICSLSYSQNVVSIKGKVVDETSKTAIQSATVYLSYVKDSTVVDYTITDKNGKFEFKIKKINQPVFLKVSFISYQDFKLPLKSIEADKDFGTIELKDAMKSLNEVV
ncbi:carboxypeptidase-like regulatory domain-containing protein, partial [Flavobacterium sp.]|uniref:carboxypeptidase-like regulatory domain-containing protein n=1 Tax=Flavobacterium sp. TaxID=239 RepID=UPI003BD1E72E